MEEKIRNMWFKVNREKMRKKMKKRRRLRVFRMNIEELEE